MKTTPIILTMALLLISCKQTPSPTSEIQRIDYGTSFGFCMGYCIKTMTIENDLATLRLESRSSDLETKTCVTEVEARELFSKVDLESFRLLPDTLGCPDCADGGSEWVEVHTDGGIKRVTFEYQNEPTALRQYMSDLRGIFDKLGDCEN